MNHVDVESVLAQHYERLAPRPTSLAFSSLLGIAAGVALVLATVHVSSNLTSPPAQVPVGAVSLAIVKDLQP